LFQQHPPIIVKLIEKPHDPTGLADVLLRSLGVTGVLTVIALLLGLLFAGVKIWLRSRE
jgi:hypothetical protein